LVRLAGREPQGSLYRFFKSKPEYSLPILGARPKVANQHTLPRILLIDDTPETAELLSFALRDRGYEVSAEGYTTSLNELIREQRADALVLNLTTWDMSEWLFDSVREDAGHRELPVVIISDTPEKAEPKLRERKAQRVLLVAKPFTGGQVAQALAQLLE